jgi:Winged helix DNA-binding domain
MQGQNPLDPYVGLWSRLDGFRPERLSGLLESRRAVRLPLLRATIHLVIAEDALRLRPLVQPVLERTFLTGSPFGRALNGANLEAVTAAGRASMGEGPRTRGELRRLLGERWPDRDPNALAQAITYLVPVVQVPPRGLWGRTGQAAWTQLEAWGGRRDRDGTDGLDFMVRRYLATFGPATVADIQAWSGLTRLREVVDRLRPGLRTFFDEHGRELYDVPRAPLPDPDTPAPPRFLPVFDNLYLGHADRSRIVEDDVRRRLFDDGLARGPVLVDGFIEASWRLAGDRGVVTLLVEPFRRLSKRHAEAVSEEGDRLLAFLAADATAREVRLFPPA